MNLVQFYTHLLTQIDNNAETPPLHKNEDSPLPNPDIKLKDTKSKTADKVKKQPNILSAHKIGTTLFIKSANEIKIVAEGKQYEITLSGVDKLNFDNEKRQQFWDKRLRSFLYESLMRGEPRPKIFVEMHNSEANVYFDYAKKDSLLARITKLHVDFSQGNNQKNPAPHTPKW